jgi:CSLREA domain-containing protein
MRLVAAAFAAIVSFLTLGSSAFAATDTFVVTRLDDPNFGVCNSGVSCSLRQAVAAANANANPDDTDNIVFAPGLQGTILLNDAIAGMTIDEDLRITGPGYPYLIIDGAGDSGSVNGTRIFLNNGPKTLLELIGVTLQNGRVQTSSGEARGGCIFNGATNALVLRAVRVSGCRARGNGVPDPAVVARGGAIYSEGSLQIFDSLIDLNTAVGGIGHGTVPGAFAHGGAIDAPDGVVVIRRSRLANNVASGGAKSAGPTGGDGFGGALNADSAVSAVTLENVEIDTNGAQAGTGGNSRGGGLRLAADANVKHATIINSSAGGGIFLTTGDFVFTNSVIALNVGGNCFASAAGSISGTFNLQGDTGCASIGIGAAFTGDPLLGQPQDNGGYFDTRKPANNSPVINAGSNAGAPDHDARGRPRALTTTDKADIGAFEVNAPLAEVSKLADTMDGVCTPTDCSLREAIAAVAPGETVRVKSGIGGTLATNGGAVLNAFGELRVDKNLTLVGSSQSSIANSIIGGNHHRVLTVGTVNPSATVLVRWLGMSNGRMVFPDATGAARGGGIFNQGILTIEDSDLFLNTAEPNTDFIGQGQGGSIYNENRLTLRRSVVRNSTAEGRGTGGNGLGGGIYSQSTVANALVIDQSTIRDNTAQGGNSTGSGRFGYGGGIAVDGSMTLTNSTVEGNDARGGFSTDGPNGGSARGGGIGVLQASGTVSLTNVTISNNIASGANDTNGGAGRGGGMESEKVVTLTNVTISNNSVGPSTQSSGGGYQSELGVATMRNTLIANNTHNGNPANCGRLVTVYAGDHNLTFGDATCPAAAGFATGNPQLGALANNGGPTQTRLLGAGSAAIDRGTCFGTGIPKTDQRGQIRPSGDTCDIGAIEVFSPDRAVSPSNPATKPGGARRGTGGTEGDKPTPRS